MYEYVTGMRSCARRGEEWQLKKLITNKYILNLCVKVARMMRILF